VVHFAQESVVHFRQELLVHFAQESLVQFGQEYSISECDIQSTHYSILSKHLQNSDYFVSTEWSVKDEKFGKIDLVVCKKKQESFTYDVENRKDCYGKLIPQYFVEYKADYANNLSKKQINSLLNQVPRIIEFAYRNPGMIFRGAAILFHEGQKFDNTDLIEKEFLKMEKMELGKNLEFIFIYFNSKQNIWNCWYWNGITIHFNAC